jgi:hypothetical protein
MLKFAHEMMEKETVRELEKEKVERQEKLAREEPERKERVANVAAERLAMEEAARRTDEIDPSRERNDRRKRKENWRWRS